MKKIFKAFRKSSSSSSSSSSSESESEAENPREEKPIESPPKQSWSITHSDIEVPRPKQPRAKSAKPAVRVHHGRATEEEKEKRPVSWQSKPKHRVTMKRRDSQSSYPEEKTKLMEKPRWEMLSTIDALPPRSLTVTSIKQNTDLQEVLGLEAAHAEGQSSNDWLMRHSIDAEALTIDEILKCGIRIKPPSDANPDTAYIKYDEAKLQEFEFKLNNVINLCQERINWLLRGSRRSFGLVKGNRVALLVDSSDANCGYGRLRLFQESLQELINEQLINKEMLFMVSFGTKVRP
ncbi:von Willebrand factor A domain-containing protein 3A-like, partial [Actinia tenebrosa]|uniref:von Willebrand factor A domain-containing protein 3A-like n=1 Tax=Actinia tenebrosa TaxID=6105 RepID=A0A6P8H7T7_ACTTE